MDLAFLLVKDTFAFSFAVKEVSDVTLTIWPLILSLSTSLPIFHGAHILAAIDPNERTNTCLLAVSELPIIHVTLGTNDSAFPMKFVVAEPPLVDSSIFLNEDTSSFSDHSP